MNIEKQVGVVAEAVGHALDNLDLVVDVFEDRKQVAASELISPSNCCSRGPWVALSGSYAHVNHAVHATSRKAEDRALTRTPIARTK